MKQSEKDKEKKCLDITKQYIKDLKKQSPKKFRLTYRGRRSQTGLYVVDAIFEEDLKIAVPGGGTGKSIQVHIDLRKEKVEKTLRWQ